jgi:putative peptide maturation dehydrogenase
MGKIRRTTYASFSLEDDYVFDAVSLLQGILPAPARAAQIIALAVLTGERHRIARADWDVLMSIPSDRWVRDDRFDRDAVRRLVDLALVLSDTRKGPLKELRERDEALTANAWHPYAALYHFSTQWSGVTIDDGGDSELAAQTAAAVRELVAEHGPAPVELPDVSSTTTLSLPDRARPEPFYRTLTERRTTRAFDPERRMSLDDLDTVLRYVFGAHGYAGNGQGVACIKRTSASAGGLHPVIALPIVSHVEGVAPGIYHYNAGDHSLALLEKSTREAAQKLASEFMCGQRYFGQAHVSLVLVARFNRNHWKYRRHPRAYAGILMDAAHLSQTLYLVATELGLGAYFTLAINGRDIEERLGLDGVERGVIAICGCGPRSAHRSPLEPEFAKWQPRRDQRATARC